MSWVVNATARRAYKVVRRIEARKTIVLCTWCGLRFEESESRLREYGYSVVTRKPAYAQPGRYDQKGT